MIKKFGLLVSGILLSVSAFSADLVTLTKQAESGDADAQMTLADYYRSKNSYASEFYWNEKLARQGNMVGQYNLGIAYEKGLGVLKNDSTALEWYLKSANQGYSNAEVKVGVMYEQGRGTSQNFLKALEWYQRAANQGNGFAQFYLGVIYDYGHGVKQDKDKAFEWYIKAANQNILQAQVNLGIFYIKGDTTFGRDFETGKSWLKLACQNGEQRGCNALKFINSSGH